MSKEDCNCGQSECTCNEDEPIVTLTLDNDEVVDCAILTIYKAAGSEYIALLPLDESDEGEEDDVFIYRYKETTDGTPELENIEDDDEYEVAADAFDEWLDTQEFDESDDTE